MFERCKEKYWRGGKNKKAIYTNAVFPNSFHESGKHDENGDSRKGTILTRYGVRSTLLSGIRYKRDSRKLQNFLFCTFIYHFFQQFLILLYSFLKIFVAFAVRDFQNKVNEGNWLGLRYNGIIKNWGYVIMA